MFSSRQLANNFICKELESELEKNEVTGSYLKIERYQAASLDTGVWVGIIGMGCEPWVVVVWDNKIQA